MVDKLGIDVALRLSGVYQSATTYNPFPIRADAPGYELYDWTTLSEGQRIYNAGVACRSGTNSHAPLRQLKHIWQNSVLIGIGQDRRVNGERIIFFYEDDVCVYPAQSFDSLKYTDSEWTSESFYSSLTTSSSTDKYFIERNGGDYFGGSEDLFTTFYAPIVTSSLGADLTIGVVGF